MVRTTKIEPVPLRDDGAQHALHDLLGATRRTNEHLSYGAAVCGFSHRISHCACDTRNMTRSRAISEFWRNRTCVSSRLVLAQASRHRTLL
jgi:hypothetical protein